MYRIKSTSRYRKSIKRVIKSGRHNLGDIDYVINIIANGIPLHPKYRNHTLQGQYKEFFECHIKNDLLLIYSIDTKSETMLVVDIGSHSDLFI